MVRRIVAYALAGAVSAALLPIVADAGIAPAFAQSESDSGLLLVDPAPRPTETGINEDISIGGNWVDGSSLTMTTFVVGQGDTLIDLLVAAGSNANDADSAIDAVDAIFDARRLQIGQVVTAVFRRDDDGSTLAAVSIALDDTDYIVASRMDDGGFQAERTDEPLSDALLAPVIAAPSNTSTDDIYNTSEMEIRRGDTLIRLAIRAGATRNEADQAITALTKLVDPTSLQVGQILLVTFTGSGAETSLAALSLELADNQYVVAERLASGSFDAYRSDASFSVRSPAPASGDIDVATALDSMRASGAQIERMTIAQGDTLMDLIVEAGASLTEAHEAARILARHFDPRRLQIGQRVYVVQTPGPARSGLTVLGMVILDADDEGVVVVSRLPDDGGYEGKRILDAAEIALAEPVVAPLADDASDSDDIVAADEAEPDVAPEELVVEIEPATNFGQQIRVETLHIQPGDTLMSLLLRSGANREEADRAISALRPHYDLTRLQIDQQVRVAFEENTDGSEQLVTVSVRVKDELFIQADKRGETFIAGRTTAPVNPAFAPIVAAIPPAADIEPLIPPEVLEADEDQADDIVIDLVAIDPVEPVTPQLPVTEIEGSTQLSASAEQVWFELLEDDSIAGLLRGLTANGSEITKVIDALAQETDLANPDLGRQMVVITDLDGAGTHIIALSLSISDNETISVVLQRDGGYKARRATSHVDLSDFAMAAPQELLAEPEREWPVDGENLTYASLEIAPGGTLMNGLIDLGVETVQADEAMDSLREVFNPRSIRAGQIVDVATDGAGLHSFVMRVNPGERVEVTRTDEGFLSRLVVLPTERVVRAAIGKIESSLYQAALDGGVPPNVLADMIRAYSFDVDFQREIRTGDSFELVYEEFVDEDGNTVRYGPPLFASLKVSGVTLPIYQFTPSSGFIDYFNDKGESVRKALLRTPIDGAQVTSNFGMRTLGGFTRMHKGTDFGAATGTPIVAAGDGVVDQLGWFGGYGNYVRIRHNDTYKTAYAHMSAYASGLAEGDRVRQGEVIGYVGSTGNSTGPHLHYEVMVHDEQINPLDVRLPSGETLTGEELERFYVERDTLDAAFTDLISEQYVASGD